MFVKAEDSKGFTLVELMIVVAIIGILAAVAVPYYQRYVAKSRLTSLVMPSVHATETNISTYFAVRATMPNLAGDSIKAFLKDADTYWVEISEGGSGYEFKIHVNTGQPDKKESTRYPLKALGTGGEVDFYAVASTGSGGQTLYWSYRGTLATELGL